MIFFIGARHSGKCNLATEEMDGEPLIAHGKNTSMEEIYVSDIFCSINDYIKEGSFRADNVIYRVKEVEVIDVYHFIDDIVSNNKDIIITCDEVGAGIVPIDRAVRDYRDIVGKMCQYIASKADEVYRVTAGLKQRIK